MGKDGLSIKGSMDVGGVVSVLEDLAKSMREGKVCVELGAEYVCLAPGESIEFELEAEEKKGKQKLAIELSWRMAPKPVEQPAAFKISSAVPEPPVEQPEVSEVLGADAGECPPATGIEATAPEAARCEPRAEAAEEAEDKGKKGKKGK